jgi:hypothetical protein
LVVIEFEVKPLEQVTPEFKGINAEGRSWPVAPFHGI